MIHVYVDLKYQMKTCVPIWQSYGVQRLFEAVNPIYSFVPIYDDPQFSRSSMKQVQDQINGLLTEMHQLEDGHLSSLTCNLMDHNLITL